MTARTPGRASAFAVSRATISAWGSGLRRVLPYSKPFAMRRSAENCAVPETFSLASERVMDRPTMRSGGKALRSTLAIVNSVLLLTQPIAEPRERNNFRRRTVRWFSIAFNRCAPFKSMWSLFFSTIHRYSLPQSTGSAGLHLSLEEKYEAEHSSHPHHAHRELASSLGPGGHSAPQGSKAAGGRGGSCHARPVCGRGGGAEAGRGRDQRPQRRRAGQTRLLHLYERPPHRL